MPLFFVPFQQGRKDRARFQLFHWSAEKMPLMHQLLLSTCGLIEELKAQKIGEIAPLTVYLPSLR